MTLKSAKDTKKEIMQNYNREPQDWHVMVGKDNYGHTDTLITHSNELWILKEEIINPYKSLGVGIKKNITANLSNLGLKTFGYRPLPTDLSTNILEDKINTEMLNNIITKTLKNDPMPINNIKSEIAIQGPILHSPKPLQNFPAFTKTVDHELKQELDNLLSSKYPHLRSMYS